MAIGAFSFSLGSVFIKMAGTRLPALEVVFARSSFMGVYCYVLARRAGADIPGHNIRLLSLRGVLAFTAYTGVFYSVIHLPLADALVIVHSFPLIVPVLAAFFLREKLEKLTLACTILGASGLLLVTKPGFLFGDISRLESLAVAAAITAALAAGFSIICIRKLTATEHPLVIVLYAAIISSVGAPLLDGWNWLLPTGYETLLLLGVGLFMSLGQHLITMGISRSTAARASIFFYLEVVFAAFLGYFFFQEIPDKLTILGAAIIIASAALTGIKRHR